MARKDAATGVKVYKYNKGNKKQEDALIKALVKLTKQLKAREKAQGK